MPSTFTWLDHSDTERQQMLDVIDLFSQQDTRDELGISTVRDTFADLLFPGVTTIQTRAKYFLFIPWMYRSLERKHVPSPDISARARREEVRLIRTLSETGEEGVIGRVAQASLQRLPSEVYWQGLGVLQIRLFPGTRAQYHRSLDRHYQRERQARTTHDGDVDSVPMPNWHPNLPEPPEDFPSQATLDLTRPEANYLSERVHAGTRGSFFSFLVAQAQPAVDVHFPWSHPLTASAPEQIRAVLMHARNFSETMHGAALLYNLLLAEALPHEETAREYAAQVDAWDETMAQRATSHRDWNREDFWRLVAQHGTVPPPTRIFIDRWIERAIALRGAVQDEDGARNLVKNREVRVKGARARLTNRSALEQWGGASGTAQLNYRWGVANTIVNDISAGLHA